MTASAPTLHTYRSDQRKDSGHARHSDSMRAALLALLPALVWGHGDHTFDLDDLSDEGMSYAERHVRCVYCSGGPC